MGRHRAEVGRGVCREQRGQRGGVLSAMAMLRQLLAEVHLNATSSWLCACEVQMRRCWTTILLLLPLVICQAQDRTVLLATHRTGNLEVLDPDTLLPFGSFKVVPLADGVVGGPEGMIFLREGLAPDFKGCCALYALDLKNRNMTKLLDPSSIVVVSPDGNHVITQRGNVGIESFNAHTLQREPGVPRSIAPGVYGLCFSHDGHLLFGASNFPTPRLDVLDFSGRKLVRRFALPEEFTILGACADNAYYLYGHHKASGQLWRVNGDGSAIGTPVSIKFPDTTPECEIHEENIVVAGDLLFLAELFGGKLDRRARCGSVVRGGVLLVDPQTGKVKRHFAPELHFAQLISSADGVELYGLDVRDQTWTSVGLVLLDSATGRILARRELASDVWALSLATISAGFVPQGFVEAITK